MEKEMSFKEKLQIVCDIFFKCMSLGFATLLIVFFAMIFMGNFVYKIHTMLFGITKNQFQVIMYSILTGYKSLIILFFVFPWISMKLVLKKIQ